MFKSKRNSRQAGGSQSDSPAYRPLDLATEASAAAAGDGPLISARSVHKTYRTGDVVVEALRGVDLDISAGEFLVIMGPSGNGKTTLLNCCSGIDDVDSGRIEIDGIDIHTMSDRARSAHRASRMGFVFQSFNLIPVLSAAENCELPLLAAGAKPRHARKRAIELLDRVGLKDRASHRPNELSGGEQQRVAIARSLVSDPAVVWADEPTGNLDSKTAEAVIEMFEEVNAGGQTLVVVTHDASIGQRADRLVTVTDGLITGDRSNRPTTGPSSTTKTGGSIDAAANRMSPTSIHAADAGSSERAAR